MRFWNWTSPEEGERTLRLDGPIDDEKWWGDEVTPEEFRQELNAGSGDITVWINSPGGSVFAADQIYNMLRDYPGKITVKIDAIAASAATIIAMAGDEVLMSPVSTMMIHNPATFAMGNRNALLKAVQMLDAIKDTIINAYVEKTGLSHKKLSDMMDDEKYLDATEAIKLGFANGIWGSKEKDEPASKDSSDKAPAVMFADMPYTADKAQQVVAWCESKNKKKNSLGRKTADLHERLELIKKMF